jgi:hypothetical protein
MAPVFICYARSIWNAVMITHMFNTAFKEDLVEAIDERSFVDESGFKYKVFMIVFSHTNDLFQEMVLSNRKAREGLVFNPLIGDRIEQFLKYTRVQSYWDITPAKIRIRLEEEMERVERIKELDRLIFAEVEYIE